MMNAKRFLSVWALLVPMMFSPSAFAQGQPAETPVEEKAEEKLPKYEDMEVPSVKQLLLEPPVDWIRLRVSDEVIVVEPVCPRPATLAKLQQEIEALMKSRPAGQAALEEWRDKRAKLNYLNVVLPGGGENPEFRI